MMRPRLIRRHLRQLDEALRDAGIVDGDVEPAEALARRAQPDSSESASSAMSPASTTRLGRQRRGELLPAGRRRRSESTSRAPSSAKRSHSAPAETAGRAGDQHRQPLEARSPVWPSSSISSTASRGEKRHRIAIEPGLLGIGGVAVKRALVDALADRREAEKREGEVEGPVADAGDAAPLAVARDIVALRTAGRAPRGRCRRGPRKPRHAAAATACTDRRGRRRDGRASTAPSRARRSRSARPVAKIMLSSRKSPCTSETWPSSAGMLFAEPGDQPRPCRRPARSRRPGTGSVQRPSWRSK